jgi:hypothetical protein
MVKKNNRTVSRGARLMSGGLVPRSLIYVLILGLLIWEFIYRDYLIDSYTLLNYQPASNVSQVAENSDLTDLGKRYFYASRPEINDRSNFNNNCKVHNEKTVVLGCYADRRIYLFNVTDSRLSGIEEVTAAHEMLHAAYDRLTFWQKNDVDRMVEAWYPHITDQRIKDIMVEYATTEPGQRDNELHSILATEVRNLSPELEDYYKQYFTDREKVVAYSEGYESVFIGIQNQQEQLSNELSNLASQVNSEVASYNAEFERLSTDVNNFNAKASKPNGFSSIDDYNSGRDALLARQEQLSNQMDRINQRTSDYNNKRAQLEDLNGQTASLSQSVNSLASPPKIQ